MIILIPILIAIISGLFILNSKLIDEKQIAKISLILTSIVSLTTFLMIFLSYGSSYDMIRINELVAISFKVDGLGSIFAGMVSILWIFACVYASKYMTHEGGFKKFYAFYILTFGTVLGLSFSGNMFTMYICYEILTFITLPLVVHNNKPRDKYAGVKYVFYSIFGASLSFSGMMIFAFEIGRWEFIRGGITNGELSTNLLIAFILMFVGFGVKAGIFPLHKWLVGAGVAPTPVTALLHAVAVVKSGAFAVMRTTFYLYDPNSIAGTFAQYVVVILAIITIIVGSSMAMKSKHIKRRLAYSTMSQLSYILLAVSTMTYAGLIAGVFHMIAHAFVKIVLFYGIGNVIFQTHKDYIKDIQGYGKQMKITFVTFTICSLSLIGIPPFIGFFSKYAIAQSLFEMNNNLTFFAVLALIISALLTAMYLLQIVIIAFVPYNDFDEDKTKDVREAPKEMSCTLVGLTAIVVCISIFGNNVYNLIENMILGGVI